jgi:photosystem II stability/assembly factor-like uncharacterized protein
MKRIPRSLPVALLLSAAVLVAVPQTRAEPWMPTARQPAGGRGYEVTLGHSAATIATLYACVENHDSSSPANYIYKSMDYGETWREVLRARNLFAVRTHPFHPEVVFAGRDGLYGDSIAVYRSRDAGITWQPCTNGIDRPTIGTIAISLSNPNVVYAGGGHRSNPGKLYRSDNGGDSWVGILPAIEPKVANISDIVVHPADPHTVLFSCVALLSTHRGIYKSPDGGITWRQVFNGTPIYSLAISPTDPNVMYAGGAGYFLKSADGGESWSLWATLPNSGLEIYSIAPHPSDANRIWLSRKSLGLYYSEDGGLTWERQNNSVWLTDMWLTRLTIDPLRPEVMFAGEYDAGFYRTFDGGVHWNQVSVWNPGRRLDRLLSPTVGHLCALSSIGTPEISTDNGVHWSTTLRTNALTEKGDLVCPLPGVCVVALSYLPMGDGDSAREPSSDEFYESRILRSADGGFTWSSRYVFPGEGRLRDLALTPSLPARVYGTGLYYNLDRWDAFIIRSEDSGDTWQQTADGLSYSVKCLAADPQSADLVYLGCDDGTFLVSTDGGVTVEHRGDVGAAVRCLAVDRSPDTDLPTLYAGTASGVYWSGDDGRHWQCVNSGIVCVDIEDLVIHPERPCWLWAVGNDAAGNGHVYVTQDAARNWIEQGEGFPAGICVNGLSFSPPSMVQARMLYAATSWGAYSRSAVPDDSGSWEPCPCTTEVTEGPREQAWLSGNAPNPFRDHTSLRLELTAPGVLDVAIFDVTGRQVRRLASGRREAGIHTITWDGRDDAGHRVAAGVYQCRVRTQDWETARTVVLAD